MLWAVPATGRGLYHFWCTAWVSTRNGCHCLSLMQCLVWTMFDPHSWAPSSPAAALAPGWTHVMKQVDLSRCLSQARGHTRVILGNQPPSFAVSVHPLLVSEGSKHVCTVMSRDQASHSCPPTARSTCLLAVRRQSWGVQYVTSANHSVGGISTCVTFRFFWVPYQGHRS